MTNSSSLAVISEAAKMIEKASTVQEAKELKGKLLVLAEWAKQMKLGEAAEQKARRYALRAERKMGEMLRDSERAKPPNPNPPKRRLRDVTDEAPTLAVLGLSKRESAESQKLASIPTEKFDRAVETARSAAEVVRIAAGAHVGRNTGEHEWYTPKEYIEAARAVMGCIDLDPASTEVANEVVQADAIFTEEQDGLKQDWAAKIWLNPPYAQPLCDRFCAATAKKYESGEVREAIVLINNATETKFFQGLAKVASAICFPKGRIRFLNPDGEPGSPLQGQAILYLGNKKEVFSKTFEAFGLVVEVAL